MSHESAMLSVAAKVALANKRKRDANGGGDTDSAQISPDNDTPLKKQATDEESKTEETDECAESKTEAETEKVTPEKGSQILPKFSFKTCQKFLKHHRNVILV